MKCSNKVVSFIAAFLIGLFAILATLLGVWGVESYGSYQPRGVSAQNQFIEDQLDRADAGSWQIADGGATRKAAKKKKIDVENNGMSPDNGKTIGSIPHTPTLRVLAA